MHAGAQVEAAKEAPTNVENSENPEEPPKEPVEPPVKRQHLIVMRHGERIDEVPCELCHLADNAKTINMCLWTATAPPVSTPTWLNIWQTTGHRAGSAECPNAIF